MKKKKKSERNFVCSQLTRACCMRHERVNGWMLEVKFYLKIKQKF